MTPSNVHRRSLLACAAAWLGLVAAGAASAQASWPTQPVKILVGFPGGSTPDISARALADALAKAWGQTVVVENRPGAGGNVAADAVAKASDGHTLGVDAPRRNGVNGWQHRREQVERVNAHVG